METPPPARFYFDYLDPLSWLVERELERASARADTVAGTDADVVEVVRTPLELRPPPLPLLDPDGPWWRERWQAAVTVAATREGGAGSLREPGILPWTRKAHEFVAYARAAGKGDEAHRVVFEELFVRGGDIGRIDVLVGLAERLGLPATEAKAVLDVDRHAVDVAAAREGAAEEGVAEPPALVRGERVLRGFHNRDVLRTFLLR